MILGADVHRFNDRRFQVRFTDSQITKPTQWARLKLTLIHSVTQSSGTFKGDISGLTESTKTGGTDYGIGTDYQSRY